MQVMASTILLTCTHASDVVVVKNTGGTSLGDFPTPVASQDIWRHLERSVLPKDHHLTALVDADTSETITQDTTFEGPKMLTATIAQKGFDEMLGELQVEYNVAANRRRAFEAGDYNKARNAFREHKAAVGYNLKVWGAPSKGAACCWGGSVGGIAGCVAGVTSSLGCLPVTAITCGAAAAGGGCFMAVDKVQDARLEHKAANATEKSSQTIHFKVAQKQLDRYIREEEAAAEKMERFLDRDAQ